MWVPELVARKLLNQLVGGTESTTVMSTTLATRQNLANHRKFTYVHAIGSYWVARAHRAALSVAIVSYTTKLWLVKK